MMDKEDILKRSRREKDEGLTYAQDRGRQYGVVGFLVLFLVIMIYNMVRGLDNSLPLTLFWAYLSCEAAGRYFARKEKSVLATAVLAGLASLFSLVSCAGHVLGLLCGQPPLPSHQAEEHLRRGDAANLSCFFGLESGKILHTGMVRTWMNSWS